ncbi:MAG: hypothetical protein JSR72_12440 [Proteobacteria bacterium]|nr:hypothetical protein [Pseudomonadota bacterium]
MTDSSIGIQAISPFTGTSQGRNEAFRDQSAQQAAIQLANQQQDQQDEQQQHASSGGSAHQLDVTV